MDKGVIPLRHGSLPGVLRLPKRYEMCAKAERRENWKRKSSIAPALNENEGERLQDLMQAIMWVKQELILLRQHDILLKRQFTEIHATITSLHRKRSAGKATSTSNTSLQSNDSAISDLGLDNYSFRSASSVTALNGNDTDNEDELYRPRTSSMMTTRDLAALARRRGSKDLI